MSVAGNSFGMRGLLLSCLPDLIVRESVECRSASGLSVMRLLTLRRGLSPAWSSRSILVKSYTLLDTHWSVFEDRWFRHRTSACPLVCTASRTKAICLTYRLPSAFVCPTQSWSLYAGSCPRDCRPSEQVRILDSDFATSNHPGTFQVFLPTSRIHLVDVWRSRGLRGAFGFSICAARRRRQPLGIAFRGFCLCSFRVSVLVPLRSRTSSYSRTEARSIFTSEVAAILPYYQTAWAPTYCQS